MHVNFTFIKCLIQSGATSFCPDWKKPAFLSLLTSWQSKRYEKSTDRDHSFIWMYVWCVRRSLAKRIRDNVTIYWYLMPERLSDPPHCMSSLQPAKRLLLFRQTVHDLFPSFDTPLRSILFSNLSRVVLPNILCWNIRSSRRKRNPRCRLSPGGATLCYKFDEARVKRCIHIIVVATMLYCRMIVVAVK